MFKISSFTSYSNSPIRGIEFNLSSDSEIFSENYFSVIIGPNGTGKSHLLSAIIESLNELMLLKSLKDYKPKKQFIINYLYNSDKYSISTRYNKTTFIKNNLSITAADLNLPEKWLASSATINDKYPILNYARKKEIPQYKYLGIRSASNNAFINRITINSVLYFIDILKKDRKDELINLYSVLGLSPKVQIIFRAGTMLKLAKEDKNYKIFKNTNELTKSHITYIKENKSEKNYRIDNYQKVLDNPKNIDNIFSFIKLHRQSFEKAAKSSIHLTYEIDLKTTGSSQEDLLADWDTLSDMLDLELLKISNFYLHKEVAFTYEESSSGESHLLTSLHGIISNCENDSVIIIDEPEISLHPNWQIDYIDILKNLISSFKGIHIIISTHSNLLVTNLKNEESQISLIRRNKQTHNIETEVLEMETYGLDPESILYNVFEIATLRNKYFELDLRKLIALITEQSTKFEEIKNIRDKVGKYISEDNDDPLKLLIKEVDNYLSEQNAL